MEFDPGQKPKRIFGQEFERAKRALANLLLIPGLLTYGSLDMPSDCPAASGETVWQVGNDTTENKQTTRATTLNIASGRYGIDQLAESIEAQQSDIFGLQEVRHSVARQLLDRFEDDGYSLVFDQTLAIGGDPYGNAIFTRYTVMKSARYKLPTLGYQEPRSLLVTELLPDGLNEPPLVAAVTHITPDTPGLFGRSSHSARKLQSNTISDILSVYKHRYGRVLLMADLNDNDTTLFPNLTNTARYVPSESYVTHPFSKKGIDFVLTAGMKGATHVSVFGANSDHCGVSVDIDRSAA